MGFLPKTVCNVKEVEFARAVKLNKTSIDLITFQVPRVKVSVLNHHAEKMFCGMLYKYTEHYQFHTVLNCAVVGKNPYLPHKRSSKTWGRES